MIFRCKMMRRVKVPGSGVLVKTCWKFSKGDYLPPCVAKQQGRKEEEEGLGNQVGSLGLQIMPDTI